MCILFLNFPLRGLNSSLFKRYRLLVLVFSVNTGKELSYADKNLSILKGVNTIMRILSSTDQSTIISMFQSSLAHQHHQILPTVDTQKDTANISAQGNSLFHKKMAKSSKNPIIESLMKQRESIEKMKNDLTDRTLNKGEDISMIKEQLKEFEKQISDIDKKIAEEQINQRNNALGKNNNSNSNKSEQHQTETEQLFIQAKTLNQIKNISKVKSALNAETNTLKSEIKIDAGRGVFSNLKYNQLSNLESKINDIQQKIGKELKKQTDDKKDDEQNNSNVHNKQINNINDQSLTQHDKGEQNF